MPQQYQDPIESVIQGILQGAHLRQSMQQQQIQNEAHIRMMAQQDRDNSIKDIMNRMELENAARPVNNGTVQLPGAAMPNGLPNELGLGAPQPGPGYLAKADPKRTVKYKDSQGQQLDYELYTPQEQMQRSTDMARNKARFDQQMKAEGAFADAQTSQQILDKFGGKPEKLGEGDTLVQRQPGGSYKTLATSPKAEPPATGDRAIFEKDFKPGWLMDHGIAPGEEQPIHRMKALADYQKMKDAGQDARAEASRLIQTQGQAITLRGQNMTDARARELNQLSFDNRQPTAAQTTVATYATRLKQADPIIEEMSQGFGERTYNKLVPSWAQTERGQAFDQAERNFINSTLRRESGAVISPSEFVEARKQYIPQPGDKPSVLEQKKQNRLIVQESFKRAAGKAYADPEELLKAAGAGKPEPAAGGQITVVDPNGGKHVFANQAAADTFKKAAGIQ